MTIRKLSKVLLYAGLLIPCALSTAIAAQRVNSFDAALEKAGSDGVIAYCYGPDWSMRSNRMLRTFWNTPQLEEAAGNAILVAVPFYQDPYAAGAEKASEIQGSMPSPPRRICPSVLMFDKEGRLYATLKAGDFLLQNKEEELATQMLSKKKSTKDEKAPTNEELEEGKLGLINIKKNLELLRQQQSLLEQSESAAKAEDKAKHLITAAELSISAPQNFLHTLNALVPMDEQGYIKRSEYKPLKFLYEQLETSDGFLRSDFYEDADKIAKACKEIANNEQLKPEDRQAAYCLMIGANRRASERGNVIKNDIKKMERMDPTSKFGLLSSTLSDLWGKNKTLTSAERKAIADKKKAQEKAAKEKAAQDRRSSDRYTIE